MRLLQVLAIGLLALAGPTAAQTLNPLSRRRHVGRARPRDARRAAGRALTADDVNAWLNGYMPYALHSADVAGAVVTVVKGGQVISARVYGYADVASRRPVVRHGRCSARAPCPSWSPGPR